MTPLRAPLAALLFLFASAPGVFADEPRGILFGPWVNQASPGSATVSWVSDGSSSGSRVRIDPPAAYVRSARPALKRDELLHAATLRKLKADTVYRYRVDCGGDSAEGSFRTPPKPGPRKPLRFVVYGDTRTFPERHRKVMEAMAKELPFLFLVHVGDLTTRGRSWKRWKREFFDPARGVLERTVFWPVRGNHEGKARRYRDFFELPNNELYYSFDVGNLHYVVLDSEQEGKGLADMARWLEADLSASGAEWTLVSYHIPTYNAGADRDAWGRKKIEPILARHEVDVVVVGHSHVYERFQPIGPKGRKPVIHIVSGGGGAPFETVRPHMLLEGGGDVAELHYLLFTLDRDRLTMEAKRTDGTVLDRLTLIKRGGLYQREVMDRAVETSEAQRLLPP